MKFSWLAVGLSVASATALASAPLAHSLVTDGDVRATMATWHPVDVRGGGVSRVSPTQPDSIGGIGSLEQWMPDHVAAAAEIEILSWDVRPDDVHGLYPTFGGFGLLSQLTELSFEWYRDGSSSTAAHFTPAFRILVHDLDVGYRGATYALVWEGVYNGYANTPGFAVPADQWVHSNLTNDNFWRVPLWIDGEWVGPGYCAQNPSECHVYNRGLHDWDFSPSTVVIGMSVAAGSGWGGDYHGFSDLVTLDFVYGPRTVWDFEPAENEKR